MPIGRKRLCGRPPAFPPMPHCRRMSSTSSHATRPIYGRVVEVAGGGTRHLATRDAAREAIDPGWILRFLRVITDPNVAFILMLVGIYGLIFELSSPGAVAPGVIGTICLLL